MKKWIAGAIAVFSINAYAWNDVACADNRVGGYICLSDYHSNCGEGYRLYRSTDTNGNQVGKGCYIYHSPWVEAIDFDGERYRWALSSFEMTDYGRDRYGH